LFLLERVGTGIQNSLLATDILFEDFPNCPGVDRSIHRLWGIEARDYFTKRRPTNRSCDTNIGNFMKPLKTLVVTIFLGFSALIGCEEQPRLGEVVRIEVKNSRTCNFFVEPLDGGSTVIVQNGCDHHQIGDIIEIP
jgi:hypothetical protein